MTSLDLEPADLLLSQWLCDVVKPLELAPEHQFRKAVVVELDVVDICFGKIELHDRTKLVCPRRR
jgi:hypothetical protein